MLNFKKNFLLSVGIVSGFLSGFLGAGGGLIVVPSLVKSGINQKNAHATSVAIMFPICASLAIMHVAKTPSLVHQSMPYVPVGVMGAVLGALILPKTNKILLRKMFGCFSLWAAYKLLVG